MSSSGYGLGPYGLDAYGSPTESDPDNFSDIVTGGLASTIANPSQPADFASLIFGGLPGTATSPVAPSQSASLASITPTPDLSLDPSVLAALKVTGATGSKASASPFGAYDIGGGRVLTFDSSTLNAEITPVLDPNNGYSASGAAFSGANCRIMIEIQQTPSFNGSSMNQRVGYQLLEATAITVSSHRSKAAVRSLGYINPKGYARGSRTIAGTIMLNRFTREVLYRFIMAELQADISKDTNYSKLDQLPPFNLTLMLANEFGFVSSQRLLGLEFITDGTVIAIDDMLLEQTLTYVATDMTPLVPANFDTLFNPSVQMSGASAAEQTVSGLFKKLAS